MKILYVENHAVFADNVTRQFLSEHAVTVVPGIAAAEQAGAIVSRGRTARALEEGRIRLDDGEEIDSVIGVWPAADWNEREAYDLFGIVFRGHPYLVRILMPEDWEGHPLRKDYPLGGEPVRFSGEA